MRDRLLLTRSALALALGAGLLALPTGEDLRRETYTRDPSAPPPRPETKLSRQQRRWRERKTRR